MASARPAPGCSLATTAESGAGMTPTASARRSAACGAVTTCACVQPKVGATEQPPRASLVVPSHPQLCIFCLPEKPGICPLSEQAAGSRCQDPCAGDGQCPGDEKCCSTRCGHVCMAPEPGEGAVMGLCQQCVTQPGTVPSLLQPAGRHSHSLLHRGHIGCYQSGPKVPRLPCPQPSPCG